MPRLVVSPSHRSQLNKVFCLSGRHHSAIYYTRDRGLVPHPAVCLGSSPAITGQATRGGWRVLWLWLGLVGVWLVRWGGWVCAVVRWSRGGLWVVFVWLVGLLAGWWSCGWCVCGVANPLWSSKNCSRRISHRVGGEMPTNLMSYFSPSEFFLFRNGHLPWSPFPVI